MDLRNRRHTPGWYLKSKGLYSFGFHACMVPLIVVNFRCKEVIPNIPSIYRIMWFIILNNKIIYIYHYLLLIVLNNTWIFWTRGVFGFWSQICWTNFNLRKYSFRSLINVIYCNFSSFSSWSTPYAILNLHFFQFQQSLQFLLHLLSIWFIRFYLLIHHYLRSMFPFLIH